MKRSDLVLAASFLRKYKKYLLIASYNLTWRPHWTCMHWFWVNWFIKFMWNSVCDKICDHIFPNMHYILHKTYIFVMLIHLLVLKTQSLNQKKSACREKLISKINVFKYDMKKGNRLYFCKRILCSDREKWCYCFQKT